MADAVLEIEGVSKRFGEKLAVDNLDLQVPEGSVSGFLGPNGAGKTTTIRMVMSIIYPDTGEVRVLGGSALASKDRIGYLPEERGIYRKMKVGEFLGYIGKLKGLDGGAPLAKRIDGWLERVDLPGVKKKRCEQLSKGMQQKVQFIATVIHDPELVILDEPFSGLDPVNARLLRALIDEMRAEGRTIIFSTHVLASAEAVCDRIFMINRGRKVLDGPLAGIREKFDPKTVVVDPLENGADPMAAVEGIEGVRSVGRLDSRGDALEAHLDEGADPRRVMAAVLEATPVRGVELRRATLEDIFVSLVDAGDSEDSLRAALKSDSGSNAGGEA